MRQQSEEERQHAMKFFDFLLDRGEHVELPAIDQPPQTFRSPLDAFEQALEHEKEITSRIHDLYEISVEEKDYPAQVLLNWFVTEQVEEEKSATDILERLRLAGEDSAALLLLDSATYKTGRDPVPGKAETGPQVSSGQDRSNTLRAIRGIKVKSH